MQHASRQFANMQAARIQPLGQEGGMAWADIPSEAYVLIGVAVGGTICIITTYLNQRAHRKLEREKLREARKDALLKELGTRFQAVAMDFSAAAHSMCSLTWQAAHGNMTQSMIDDYHAEMREILPRLISGKIMVSALDTKLGDQLDMYVDLAHEVDERIGIACLAFAKDNADGLEQLKTLNVTATDFDEIIYKNMGELGSGKAPSTLIKLMTRKWSALRGKTKTTLR
jgi:hypothetical protein